MRKTKKEKELMDHYMAGKITIRECLVGLNRELGRKLANQVDKKK